MNYYTQYLSMSDFSSKLTVGMLILVVAFVIISVLRGLFQGVARQTTRFLFAGASAALAFLLCGKLYPTIVRFCDGKTVEGLFASLSLSSVYEKLPEALRNILACFDLSTVAAVSALPITLLALPLAFIALFFIFYSVLFVFSIILCGALGYMKRNNTSLTRALGGIVGAFQGVLFAAVILFPVVGFLNFAGTVAENTDDRDSAIVTVYEEHLEAAHKSPISTLMTKFGAEKIYANMTTVSLVADGEKTDTRVIAEHLIAIYTEIDGMGEFDLANITPEQKERLTTVVDIVGEDTYLATVVAGLVRGVSGSSLIENKLLSSFDALVHREAGTLPVTGCTQLFLLLNDPVAVFVLPIPHTLQKFFATKIIAGQSLLAKLLFHLDLSSNAGMVYTGQPQGAVTLHPLEADQSILQRRIHSVTHVELTGNIGRRHDDGKGFGALFLTGTEISSLFPHLIDSVFNLLGFINLRQFSCHFRHSFAYKNAPRENSQGEKIPRYHLNSRIRALKQL